MTAAVMRGLPYGGTVSRQEPSGGVSSVAQAVVTKLKQFTDDSLRSATGLKQRGDPLAELWDLYREARSRPECEEQAPPTPHAIQEALQLLSALPEWAPPPRPTIEPTGAVGLEWYLGPGWFFVLAVDGSGSVEYSAILGRGNEHHGRTNFSGSLPRQAQNLLGDLLRG